MIPENYGFGKKAISASFLAEKAVECYAYGFLRSAYFGSSALPIDWRVLDCLNPEEMLAVMAGFDMCASALPAETRILSLSAPLFYAELCERGNSPRFLSAVAGRAEELEVSPHARNARDRLSRLSLPSLEKQIQSDEIARLFETRMEYEHQRDPNGDAPVHYDENRRRVKSLSAHRLYAGKLVSVIQEKYRERPRQGMLF